MQNEILQKILNLSNLLRVSTAYHFLTSSFCQFAVTDITQNHTDDSARGLRSVGGHQDRGCPDERVPFKCASFQVSIESGFQTCQTYKFDVTWLVKDTRCLAPRFDQSVPKYQNLGPDI